MNKANIPSWNEAFADSRVKAEQAKQEQAKQPPPSWVWMKLPPNDPALQAIKRDIVNGRQEEKK